MQVSQKPKIKKSVNKSFHSKMCYRNLGCSFGRILKVLLVALKACKEKLFNTLNYMLLGLEDNTSFFKNTNDQEQLFHPIKFFFKLDPFL